MLWAGSASGEYPVFVGPGLLGDGLLATARRQRFCVTDAAVGPLYAERLEPLAGRIEVQPGETAKTMAEAERVLRELARAGMTREDHVVALGGGVVGDLAGFCAHLYQRGVPVVQVPTTLVAQVDSAYGGKTGVDLPEGKNYAGAYHLPAAVLADTATLASLPARGAGGRLRRAAEDRAAGRRRALGARACARGARPRAARRRSSSPALATSARSSPPTSATPACAPCSTSATRWATRSRRRAATSATATARRSGSACWRRCGSPRRRSCATRSRRSCARHELPIRLDPAIDLDETLAALQRDKKRTAEGVGFVLLSEPGDAPDRRSWSIRLRSAPPWRSCYRMTTAHNRVAVLHGVNFDILDRRDPEVYGGLSLRDLETKVERWARELGLETIFFQTNSEGEFVEYLHRLPELADASLVNAGAWSHYSRAIADALDVAQLPSVEVHLSDVESRDEWRRLSVFDGLVLAKISGKGPDGYREALELLAGELGAGPG